MGLARVMIKHVRKVEGLDGVVDIIGIGGDGANMMITKVQLDFLFLKLCNFIVSSGEGNDRRASSKIRL